MLSLDLLNGIINKYFDTNFKGVEDALKRRQKVGKLQKIIINKYCKQYKIIKLGTLDQSAKFGEAGSMEF